MSLPASDAVKSPTISGALRGAFYLVLIGIALLEVFVSFRGLDSAAGMEQAQLAREVARGHGWVTKSVRPAAWRQALDARPEGVRLEAFEDSSNAPMQALVLAPWFKLAESWWEFDPARDGAVYVLDRIVAAIGVIFLLLTVYHLHGLALRLFDEKVAAVAAAGMGFCEPLWELAVSGSPRMLLGLELVLVLRLVFGVLERQRNGVPAGGRRLMLGVMLALMAMTHWMGGVWAGVILVGMLVAIPGAGRWRILALVIPGVVVLGAWGWRNVQLTGDMMGAAKLTLRAMLSGAGEEVVGRSFSDTTEVAGLPQVLRVTALRMVAQWQGIYGHLGMMLAAPLFVVVLAHRFRRRECAVMLWLVAALLGTGMVAMALMGPVGEGRDEHNVLVVLAPVLSVFGVALATMMWVRLHPGGRGWWERWGHGVVLVGVTALPLLTALPDALRGGLMLRGRLSQWPPYAADRVALVNRLLEPGEVVMADAPWFVAWYADVTAIWMPVRREEFAQMKAEVERAKGKVAGVVITPVSGTAASFGALLEGTWAEWPDLIFRGPMLAFDREMRTWPDFPYRVAVPLMGFSAGDTEGLGLLMAFYTDKQRTERVKR